MVIQSRGLFDPMVLALSAGVFIASTTVSAILRDPNWLPNVWLLVGLLVLMGVQLLTHWRHQSKFNLPLDVVDATIGKAVLLTLVVAGVVVDGILTWFSPIGFVSEEVLQMNWVTHGVIIWLVAGQLYLLLEDIGRSEGQKAIPPVLRQVVQIIRDQDEKRWPKRGHPHDRWYDALSELTDEEIQVLIERRNAKKAREIEAKLPPTDGERDRGTD